jgi:hypothetical protein
MNLAAMLLAPPQHKALARKVQRIFKRIWKACRVFALAAEQERFSRLGASMLDAARPPLRPLILALSGG